MIVIAKKPIERSAVFRTKHLFKKENKPEPFLLPILVVGASKVRECRKEVSTSKNNNKGARIKCEDGMASPHGLAVVNDVGLNNSIPSTRYS